LRARDSSDTLVLVDLGGDMAGFVQIIEYKTSRVEEVQALADDMRESRTADGATSVARVTTASDRERPGHYLTIAEFDSYEAAMENSARPETSEFAAKMAELCDGPPRFYNLDVQDEWLP
jgi:quinol monooxygenase YgiN